MMVILSSWFRAANSTISNMYVYRGDVSVFFQEKYHPAEPLVGLYQ